MRCSTNSAPASHNPCITLLWTVQDERQVTVKRQHIDRSVETFTQFVYATPSLDALINLIEVSQYKDYHAWEIRKNDKPV